MLSLIALLGLKCCTGLLLHSWTRSLCTRHSQSANLQKASSTDEPMSVKRD